MHELLNARITQYTNYSMHELLNAREATLSWQKRFLEISSQPEVAWPRELVHRSRNFKRYHLVPFL